MMRVSFLHAARAYMALRECLVPDRRKESQEEIVADLHTCLEQLIQRSTEMENKITVCMQRAVAHMKFSEKDPTPSGKNRERARARMYMEDKRRIQAEYDKTQRSIHMLQQQIDNIVSSHMDMAIVDAMRLLNSNASRLALPERVEEIVRLGEELAERQSEVTHFQEAMQEVSTACIPAGSEEYSDDLLMQELDAYMKGNSNDDINAAIAEESRTVSSEVTKLPSPPTQFVPQLAMIVEPVVNDEAEDSDQKTKRTESKALFF